MNINASIRGMPTDEIVIILLQFPDFSLPLLFVLRKAKFGFGNNPETGRIVDY